MLMLSLIADLSRAAGVAVYSLTKSMIGGVEQALARRMLGLEAP
jgi:hypothetical protein